VLPPQPEFPRAMAQETNEKARTARDAPKERPRDEA
jgi:hypothetical protein